MTDKKLVEIRMKLNRLKNVFRKDKRGIIPLIPIIVIAILPIAVWFLWELATKTQEKL